MMTSLEHMEEAIEAAHEAPNEVCVRICLEAADTHLQEVRQHLDGVRGTGRDQ
jgi:collagenase-like PrtC family protease